MARILQIIFAYILPRNNKFANYQCVTYCFMAFCIFCCFKLCRIASVNSSQFVICRWQYYLLTCMHTWTTWKLHGSCWSFVQITTRESFSRCYVLSTFLLTSSNSFVALITSSAGLNLTLLCSNSAKPFHQYYKTSPNISATTCIFNSKFTYFFAYSFCTYLHNLFVFHFS